ncbi:hypothetical protein T01_625 [Trichinella spiralis]|uniref:Uncharacterized protein n=1 Tax=Trichinella spiralis TaxID=6334 RepID=A0A0V1AZU2_TRISP|nr:hypothetical protein T01_625 [Trichinella spiralis]
MEKKRRKTETVYIVGKFWGENCQLTGELTVVGFHVEKFHGNVPCSHALRRFAKEVVSRNIFFVNDRLPFQSVEIATNWKHFYENGRNYRTNRTSEIFA